mmetsp:Transcript_14681/g.17609  ORF Transcript_14681/g.17609 Transcript_14681/m.17609 type:complete len:88 (+) Transcript_14681:43-306(+)
MALMIYNFLYSSFDGGLNLGPAISNRSTGTSFHQRVYLGNAQLLEEPCQTNFSKNDFRTGEPGNPCFAPEFTLRCHVPSPANLGMRR